MRILVIGLGRINVKNKDGGAIRLYRVLKYLLGKHVSIDILIPKRDLFNFRDYRIKANFCLLSDPRWMGDNVILLYTWRIVRGILFAFNYKQNVDVVYSASDFWHDFLPALVFKLRNPKTKFVICLFLVAPPPWKRYEDMYSDRISFPHPWLVLFYLTQRITIWLGKYACDAFLVLNDADRSILKKGGISKNKIFVVSMGVDIRKKFPRQVITKYDGIFLGRLHPQKGVSDLIKIWQQVVKKKPKATLAIVGGGSSADVQRLLTDIEQRGLANNIKYLGYLDGEAKEQVLRESKVMLVPSHYESWGQVIVEGIANNIPVVAFDLLVYRNIFSSSIYVVPCWSTDNFAARVLSILDNPMTINDKIRQAYNYVRKYEWEEVGQREHEIIKEI